MRLRYLHVRNYPPLQDVAIAFNAESPLQEICAIRFVVGVNGTGKTHLLQALTETFLALARQQRPHFPVTVAYELGEEQNRRTFIFSNPGVGHALGWWQSSEGYAPIPADYLEHDWTALLHEIRNGPTGWEALIEDGSRWPGEGVGLPQTVLIYTTGDMTSWEALFRYEPTGEGIEMASPDSDYDTRVERPADWNRRREIEHLEQVADEESLAALENLRRLEQETVWHTRDQAICLLVTPFLLKFALLAVSLPLAMEELKRQQTDDEIAAFIERIKHTPDQLKTEGPWQKLRWLFSQIGWVWPVSVVLQLDFRPDRWTETQISIVRELYQGATTVTREPEPSTLRHLYFDLKERVQSDDTFTYCGDALLDFLGGNKARPFDYFNRLFTLYREGLLTDMQFALRKTDPPDILLFDELSDGEQVFVCRMALFHLMEDQHDALILLDEPEVHFNDKWKREIVDIIDDVLKDTANDVLISTHSSITLTDVFNDEIVLFDRRDGVSQVIRLATTTFGADPSEVMIRLFGVPDSIGQRALEWLEQRIQEGYWTAERKEELAKLIDKVGPGFYKTELRTILKRLQDASRD